MTVVYLAISSFLILAGLVLIFLMKDFRRGIGKRVLGFRLPRSHFVDLGQYTATVFVVLFVAVTAIIFYKCATALAAYLLSDNLISFFITLRAVFTFRSGSEHQSPFIFEHFAYGFFIVPILQFITCHLIITALRNLAGSVNGKYSSTIYSDKDVLFFSFWATVLFMAGEFLSYSQSLSWFSEFAHFVYLALSNLSLLCFYLAASHIYLLNDSRYVERLSEYFILTGWQKAIIFSPANVILFTFGIGALLHTPFTLGMQFEKSNLLVVSTLILICAFFYIILKHLFARGYDLLGAVMMEESPDTRLQETVIDRNSFQLKMSVPVKYSLFAVSILILFHLRITIFLMFFILLSAFILAVLHGVFYTGGLGFSLLWAKFRNISHPSINEAFDYDYAKSTGLFAAMSVRTMLLAILTLFLLISFFPKNYNPVQNNDVVSVLDENGNPLLIRGNGENISIPIEYEQIPKFMMDILYLQEDRSFSVQHGWFPKWSNWNGISLASFHRFITRSGGGSNINMQLIKNEAFPNRTFPQDIQRKFAEAVASYQISRQLPYKEIATQYMNIAGMSGGYGHSGVMAASLHTFNRPVWDLNELEMFYLVATLTTGNGFRTRDGFVDYSQITDHANAVKSTLLAKAQLWYDHHLLTTRQLRMLRNQELRFVNKRIASETQASTRDFLISELQQLNNTSLRTYSSTLSIKNQEKMADAVQEFESRFRDQLHIGEYTLHSASLVVDVRTGSVLGHYGGKGRSDLTRFINGFPVGSPIKPFLLLELLEQGFSTDMLLYDGPVAGLQTPRNDNRPYLFRNVGLEEILGKSLNAPVVNVRLQTDPLELFHSVENRFSEMGIEPDHYLDLANPLKQTEHELNYPLGSRNMTMYDIAQAYQVLFNDGRQIPLSVFKGQYDPHNFSNKEIRKEERTIYSRENAIRIKNALRHTMLPDGTGYHLKSVLPDHRIYYAKTGTTDRAIHGYTVFSDGELLIVAWLSYGKAEDGRLDFNNTPAIPYQSGGHSAGVLAAMVYRQFNGIR